MIAKETFNIIKDFYSMRKKTKSDYLLINLFPAFIGIIAFIVGIDVHKIWIVDILNFTVDFINQTITVLALFISFSIAYVGMLISSYSLYDDIYDISRSDIYNICICREVFCVCVTRNIIKNSIMYRCNYSYAYYVIDRNRDKRYILRFLEIII